jgi:hypothetical protein
VFKLRQDNQNMYCDIKEIASTEEQMRIEILEQKNKRQELEMLNSDLQEKVSN